MRRLTQAVLLWSLAALLCCRPPGAFAADTAPAVGTVAPGFTLQSQEGKPVSLADYRGQWVVLYFYPKDFTKGCTIEAHDFQRDLKKFEALHAVVLGVSVQTADSHKKFCAEDGLHFKLLADTEDKVSTRYGSLMDLGFLKLSARHTFLIAPDGVIVKRYLSVKPGKHSQEVLADLENIEKTGGRK